MRPYLVLVSGVGAIAGIAATVCIAWAQEPQLAPEGRRLLPRPAEMPAFQLAPPPYPVERDPSGGLSRTIFETDEDPNFKIIIRDFSFPPDRQAHTITLPSTAFIHLVSGAGELSVAKQRLATPAATTAVPAPAPIEVTNNGEHAVVVRVLIVEAK
jgi:quercetin dioxygenase-like cupin family protein